MDIQARTTRQINEKKIAGSLLRAVRVECVGGSSTTVAGQVRGTLEAHETGVIFQGTGFSNLLQYAYFPYRTLVSCEFKTEEQISKDVTLARMLLFGFFAFGLKKKTKIHHEFVMISGKDGVGVEAQLTFRLANGVGVVISAINEGHQNYLATHPLKAAEIDLPALDLFTQLEKLAELRTKGIITEEEFQQKKKEWLLK